jgi:hypothetical protein
MIAAAEHLKEYVREIVYAYKDGAGHSDAPFTAELAVSAIWRKVDQMLEAAFSEKLKNTLRFRLEVKEGEEEPVLDAVIACRCLGARGKSTQVYYVICEADNYDKAVAIIQNFRLQGRFVRDWEYYGS